MSSPVYTICIPYRGMSECLCRALPQALAGAAALGPFHLVVVEQTEGRRFNLGKLLNVGFELYRSGAIPSYGPASPRDVFFFQPVDCIPVRYEVLRYDPALDFHGFTWDEPNFYKLCWFTHAAYEDVNGFSNEFWGWGDEDNEMFLRLAIRGKRTRLSPVEVTALNHKASPDYLAGAASHHDGSLTRRLRETRDVAASGLATLDFRVLAECRTGGVPHFVVEI